MKAWKKGLLILAAAALAAGVFLVRYWFVSWPLRFQGELDRFFGEGAWQCVSQETKESRMYSVIDRSYSSYTTTRPGEFREWNIAFQTSRGEEAIWTISDHTMRINHSKHFLLSRERYSARQALTLELIQLSFALAGEEVGQQVLSRVLPEAELSCLDVDISYNGGNPPPDFYDDLAGEEWFTAQKVSAACYLESDLYDFYITVRAHDYRVEKLEEDQRQHLLGSLEELCRALEEEYGDNAKYEIYLGEGLEAEKEA